MFIIRYFNKHPGDVVQWEDGAFAMRKCGFDSHRLQLVEFT